MTDHTQPDSAHATGGTYIIRYALELGLLWIDGSGRDSVRQALAALDVLDAELEAIGAGGVSGPLLGGAALAEPQQAASAVLRQSLLDPENQPNQYGVEFGMSGPQMHFKIDNQLFKLAYEPDDEEEFEFMKRMLINAFSVFTPDVKAAPQQAAPEKQFDAEGFRAWVLRNLPDDTIISNGAWWANHLTEWAQRFAKAAPQQEVPAVASKAVLTAIRAANMQLVRTGEDTFMLVTLKQPAPQQEAQEPFGYVNTHTGQFLKDVEACRKNNEGHWRTVYTAQPAPSGDAEDAERWRWLVETFGETALPFFLESRLEHSYIADGKVSIDAAVDAARKEGKP